MVERFFLNNLYPAFTAWGNWIGKQKSRLCSGAGLQLYIRSFLLLLFFSEAHKPIEAVLVIALRFNTVFG